MIVVYRHRTFQQLTFLEFLLVYDKLSHKLQLPSSIPTRYIKRILWLSADQTIVRVESSYDNASLQLLKSNDIVLGNGIWIVENDCLCKGSFGSKVLGIAQFLSFEIAEETCLKIQEISLQIQLQSSQIFSKPLSLYHGTSAEYLPLIQKNGLEVSKDGMLGNQCIYFGTIWKASRFAIKTQSYKDIKDGIVIRTLIFPKAIINVPRDGWICPCLEKCKGNKDHWGSIISDHCGQWQFQYDCIHAQVIVNEKEQEDKKCVLRNEEWAILESVPQLKTHYSFIDLKSLPGPHYDPLFRNVKIK
jgi:hypothetical protein